MTNIRHLKTKVKQKKHDFYKFSTTPILSKIHSVNSQIAHNVFR
jgi:hypothetical protein